MAEKIVTKYARMWPREVWDILEDNALVLRKMPELRSYSGLGLFGFDHRTVNHGAGEYVRGSSHVNALEGFWARLKLSIRGTHVHVSAKHLQKYVKEFEYRYNRRKRPERIFDDLVASL